MLSRTVTLWPARAHCIEADKPERPAPTTTIESRMGIVKSNKLIDHVESHWLQNQPTGGKKFVIPQASSVDGTIFQWGMLQTYDAKLGLWPKA